jgi:hypothetical protein
MDNKLTFAELQQIFEEIKELDSEIKARQRLIREHLLKSTGRNCCRFCAANHLPNWTNHPVLMLHEVFGSYGAGGR